MTTEMIRTMTLIRQSWAFTGEDYPQIAAEFVSFIDQRCRKPELLDSYRLFVLNKVAFAFNVAIQAPVVRLDSEASDELLDIPVEEFEDAKIDEDFMKKVGWVE